MQIELALSGLTQALFCTLTSVVLIGIAALLLICVVQAFIITARALLVRIRRDLAGFSEAIRGAVATEKP